MTSERCDKGPDWGVIVIVIAEGWTSQGDVARVACNCWRLGAKETRLCVCVCVPLRIYRASTTTTTRREGARINIGVERI